MNTKLLRRWTQGVPLLVTCLVFASVQLHAQMGNGNPNEIHPFGGAFIQQVPVESTSAVGLKAFITLGQGTYENLDWGTPVLKERNQLEIAAKVDFLDIQFFRAPDPVVETHVFEIPTAAITDSNDLVLGPGSYTVVLKLNGDSIAKTILNVREIVSPEIPKPSYWINLKPTVVGTTATVHATITLPSGGNTVEWGEVSNQLNQFMATLTVTTPDLGTDAIEVLEHTYDLGILEPGTYFFSVSDGTRRLAATEFRVEKPRPDPMTVLFKAEPVRQAGDKLVGTLVITTATTLDANSLGDDDLVITAEDGRTLTATYVDYTVQESMPMSYVIHYAINSPDPAGWAAADVGFYKVALPKGNITADGGTVEFAGERAGQVVVQLKVVEDPKPVRGVGLSVEVSADRVASIGVKLLVNPAFEISDWGKPELVDDCVNPYMAPSGMPVALHCLQINAVATEVATRELSVNYDGTPVAHNYDPISVEAGMYQLNYRVNGKSLANYRFYIGEVVPPPAALGFAVKAITPAITTAGTDPYEFNVVYTALDGTTGAIDLSTLGDDDIVITGRKDESRINARFVEIVQEPLVVPVLPPDIMPPETASKTTAVYMNKMDALSDQAVTDPNADQPIDPTALVVKYALDAPEGGWTFANNGHYGVNLAVGGVTYNEGTELRSRGIGELTVRIAGEPPPSVEAPLIFAEARKLFVTPVDTEGQPMDYAFRLFVIDRSGVDATTVAPAGITVKRYVKAISEKQMDRAVVTEPVTETLTATLGEVTVLDDASTVVQATYTLAAPDGTWDVNDNGNYVIFAPADVIKDADGNTFAGGPVGAFSIMIYSPAADAVEGADGWINAPFMGYFRPDTFPWFYHPDHGWWYGGQMSAKGDAASAATASDWVWDMKMNWLFVNRSIYPWMYSAETSQWVWFVEGSHAPRYFYGSADKKWQAVDANQ